MTKQSAAVIGTGIAGSGIAAMLAHSGDYDVDLYEKNNLIGGRFASYTKDGFRMDIGCHMIANSEKGTMGQILKILGQPDAVQWHHLVRGTSVFNYKGTELIFPEELHKMGFTEDEIQRVMRFFMETVAIPEDQYEKYDKISMLEQVEKYIKDDRARVFFGFISGLLYVTRDSETPVGEWVRSTKEMSLNQTTGYPIGGTGVIPQTYVRIMEACGGRIHLSTPIRRIIVEDRVAKGVELKDGRVKQSDIVISNAGLKPTVNSLVGREHYTSKFLEKVDGYEYSLCVGALKVALDEPFIQDRAMVLYIGNDDIQDMEKKYEMGIIPESIEFMMIPILSFMDPSCCPEGKQLLILGGGGSEKARPVSQKEKKLWEQSFLKSLETIYPGIGKHVMWSTYTSPMDIDNLFGEDGNVIGISQKIGQVGENRPPIKDPEIKNLYHCSADSGMHGIGGELAADSALRLYKLLLG